MNAEDNLSRSGELLQENKPPVITAMNTKTQFFMMINLFQPQNYSENNRPSFQSSNSSELTVKQKKMPDKSGI
jgi:hypothetical protein